MKLLPSILDLLYPARCAFCHSFMKRQELRLCAECRKKLPFTKGGGAQHGDFFSLCVSPLCYQDDVRASIHRYKFGGCPGYARTYGALCAACVRENVTQDFDLISWVPLSRKRLRERGYDQAKLLAEAIAVDLDAKAVSTLEKVRDAAKQSQTGSAEKRRANISGAYRAKEPDAFCGKTVLLVDDVVTTGATLSECARTLRAAGAKDVLCVTLARSKD